MSSTSTKDEIRLQSRQFESATERNGAHPMGNLPEGPLWPGIYWSAMPVEREHLLKQATVQEGLLCFDVPPPITQIGRVPPAAPHLLEWLAGKALVPLHAPAALASHPLGIGSRDSSGSLSETQRHGVERILACPSVFLLRGLPAAGLGSVLREVLCAAAAQGERTLVLGAEPRELADMLHELAGESALAPVFVPTDSQSLREVTSLRAFWPGQREWAEYQAQSEARDRGRTENSRLAAEIQRQLEEMRGWKVKLRKWLADSELVATQREKLASLRSDLEAEIGQAHAAAQQEWLRQWAANQARHETANQELRRALAAADEELASATAELDRWRREHSAQEGMLRSLRIPNPFSMKWWRALFQGRRAERLAEAKARVQDAEIRHLAARSHQQLAQENLEVEDRRHLQACEQILRSEELRRKEAQEATLAEATRTLDACLQQWQAWEPVRQAVPDSEAAPSEATLDIIRTHLEGRLAELQSASSPAAPTPEFSAAAAWQTSLQRSNAVFMLASVLTQPDAEASRWLACVYGRVIVLSAHTQSAAALNAAATFGNRLLLVAPLRDLSEPAPFDELWERCRPRSEQQTMQWLRSADRWHARWQGLTPELHAQVYRESLVDQPDIDLFIVEPPGQAPRIAALEFPAAKFSLPAAKRLCVEELGNVSIDPVSTHLVPDEDLESLHVRFGSMANPVEEQVQLESGITEILAPLHPHADPAADGWQAWRTARLDFHRSHGWDWQLVRDWLAARGGWFDPIHSHELTELCDLPGAFAEALACLDEEGVYRLPSPAAKPRPGSLAWVPSESEPLLSTGTGTERPRAKGLRRLERPGLPEPARRPPLFNVSEARLAVAAARLLCCHKNGAGRPRLHFQARSEPQLQMIREQWQIALANDLAPETSFAVDGLARPPRCDVLVYSLWHPTREGSSTETLSRCMVDAVLATRSDLCLVGPLEHLAVSEPSTDKSELSPDRWQAFLQVLREARRELGSLAQMPGTAA